MKNDKSRLSVSDIHDYVKRLPYIICEFDSVTYSVQKEEGLRFEKKFDDGTFF